METVNKFELAKGKLNTIFEIISNESNKSVAGVVKIFKLTIIIWVKCSPGLPFSEKSELLILIIQIFHQTSDVSSDIKKSTEYQQNFQEFVNKIVNNLFEKTFEHINVEELQEPTALKEFEELLGHVSSILDHASEISLLHSSKICEIVIITSVEHKNELLALDNRWMEKILYYLCSQMEVYTKKLVKDPENEEFSKLLRFYNTHLLMLSKAFPHERFRGTSHVITLLIQIHNLMNENLELGNVIHTNLVIPLFSVLKYVYGNEEAAQVIFSLNSSETATAIPILVELSKIICKNPSEIIMQQYFKENDNQNLFLILFEAILQHNDHISTPSVLSGLVGSLTLAIQSETSFQSIISKLLTSLLSDNVKNAYLSLDIWIFIARICSKEVCYKIFNELKNEFLAFPKFSDSLQKFFVGNTMRVFYMCLKNKVKKLVMEENPIENHMLLWSEIAVCYSSEMIGQDIFEKTHGKMAKFLKEGGVEDYEELLEYLTLCSVKSEQIPKKLLLDIINDLLEFLLEISSIEPFLPLIKILMKMCTNHSQNISTEILKKVLTLLEKYKTEIKLTKNLQFQILQLSKKIETKNYQEFLELKKFVTDISEETHANDKILFHGQCLIKENVHECRIPPATNEVSSPVFKKPKLEDISSNNYIHKKKSFESLLQLETELEKSGLLFTIPELNTHLREMKTLLTGQSFT